MVPESNGSFLEAGGIRTHYHEAGTGEPVVLLHGSGPGVSAWANWSNVLPALSESHRVLAPDSIGFGETSRVDPSEYGLGRWVDHIVEFMDTLEIESAHLVGNSFGGALALNLAARFPHRVRKAVLMGTVGRKFEMTEGLATVWGYRGDSPEEMRRVLEHLAYDKSIVTDELVRLRYETLNQNPSLLEAWEEMFPPPFERHLDELSTPEDEIKSVSNPMLVVHGREDEVIPPEVSWEIFELLPVAQLHVFGRCGHWTQIEKTDAFNQLVLNFLSEPTSQPS